jgi:hypothetical protein
MRPAFKSTRQAAAFAILLLVLILAPALFGEKSLPSRDQIYSSIWWENGDFPYMDSQIFREQGDLDIVLMGSSHLWAAFNTPRVQDALGKQIGKPATVRTFGWGGPGFDEMYFVAQDLLEHRHVRMLVINDDYNPADQPHILASKMFRYGDNAAALDGLPLSMKCVYYFAAISGLPRNLLSLVRPNLPADLSATSYWQTRSQAPNLATNLGAITARIGFRASPDAAPASFVPLAPQTGVQPSDVSVYSADTKTNFAFVPGSLPPMQLHFAQKLAALAHDHHCKLVIVHIPTFDERHSTVISTPVSWPDVLGANVTVIGIPPATLFRGMSDDDIRKLYSDAVHFNQNGQDYFTTLLLPTLMKCYETPAD